MFSDILFRFSACRSMKEKSGRILFVKVENTAILKALKPQHCLYRNYFLIQQL